MHLTLHLTTACNMRCDYCYAPPHPGAAMTEPTALRALELGARSTRGSCGVIFFGGEPLLHPGLIEATVQGARAMQRKGVGAFHFKVTTNGLALDDRFLELALREDILVAMSFDGVEQAHNRHRKLAHGADSFAQLLGRLKALLEVRPYASVLMVVSPDTACWVADSVEFLLELGARYLILSLDYAARWTEPLLEELRCGYERLARLYVQWTRAGRKFYLSPFEVKLASHIQGRDFVRDRCELGTRQISVAPDGSLFPCVQFTRAGARSSWCIGHVDAGVDERAKAEIAKVANRPKQPCSGCAIEARCNHTCGCLNWQATGDVQQVSAVLCRHEQMLVPIVDRVGTELYRERNGLFLRKHYDPAFPLLSLLEEQTGPRS